MFWMVSWFYLWGEYNLSLFCLSQEFKYCTSLNLYANVCWIASKAYRSVPSIDSRADSSIRIKKWQETSIVSASEIGTLSKPISSNLWLFKTIFLIRTGSGCVAQNYVYMSELCIYLSLFAANTRFIIWLILYVIVVIISRFFHIAEVWTW